MRRLCLSTIPADFDPAIDVALGPWCFSGLEDQVPGWEDFPFEDAFETPARLKEAAELGDALFEALLPGLAAELNRVHGRDYSLGFWRILLIPWVYRVIETASVRLESVRKAVLGAKDQEIEVAIAADSVDWNFQSLVDFQYRGMHSAEFNFWVSSLGLRGLAPAGWRLVEVPITADSSGKRPMIHERPRTGWRGWLRRRLGRLRFNNVGGAGTLAKLALSLWCEMVPAIPPAPLSAHQPGPRPESFSPALLGLVQTMLERTRPASFYGDFARHEGKALASTRFRKGRLYVGAATWISEDDLFLAALAEEKGEKVVSVQYGCNYGTTLSFAFAARLHYERFAFITWGWRRHTPYPGHFIPLPAPELAPVVDGYRRRDDRIILVGAVTLLHFVRLVSVPLPAGYLRYRNMKRDFFKAFPAHLRPFLHYRPYHHKGGDLEDLGYVQRLLPGIPVVEGDLTPQVMGCRLLVMDHPGSTLNMAMAANVPTVAFWEDAAWPACPDADRVYCQMRAAGIVFEDPAEAAGHIESIWDDIFGWWESDPVQAARQAFVRLNAQSRRLWWLDWLPALWRLSASAVPYDPKP